MYKELDFVYIDTNIKNIGQIQKRLKSNSNLNIYYVKLWNTKKIKIINENRLNFLYKE